ncbi:alpha-amylase [Hydrocarboniphaga sp.]|uniref:alpha-amylase n=1 Tax=Hydrocarboniphaga sp. TaxID=2033016 RepID=UPI003D14FB7B
MSAVNGVMMQYFHWYTDKGDDLWKRVGADAGKLAELGVTSLWLPPAYKATRGIDDVGYGVYDLFDLGEFDQKGSVRTKYGTRDEYLEALSKLKEVGIRVYADVVFNHRMGADETESVQAYRVDMNDRTQVAGEPETLDAWTRFTFPGRKGAHSDMVWSAEHFTAFDANTDQGPAIFLMAQKSFSENVDSENGNFDFLMGADVDTDHPKVRDELKHWGHWYLETTGVDGFRFDAVKHVDAEYFLAWLHELRVETSRDLFAVGEYWSYDVEALHHFIETTKGQISLFDAPLHLNFHLASKGGQDYDLRTIFDNSLVQQQPALAVTLVDNHDSQPLQSLESVVEPWFKPLAYALILLRRDGYPCIFFADFYGAHYTDKGPDGQDHEVWMDSHQFLIERYLDARHRWAYGEQFDYFEDASCIGWTRTGDDEHPGGMAVVISNGEGGVRHMEVRQGKRRYVDITGHIDAAVETDEAGWGDFPCPPGSVSVWVPAE